MGLIQQVKTQSGSGQKSEVDFLNFVELSLFEDLQNYGAGVSERIVIPDMLKSQVYDTDVFGLHKRMIGQKQNIMAALGVSQAHPIPNLKKLHGVHGEIQAEVNAARKALLFWSQAHVFNVYDLSVSEGKEKREQENVEFHFIQAGKCTALFIEYQFLRANFK